MGSDQGSNLCPCSGSSVSTTGSPGRPSLGDFNITSSNPSSLCFGYMGHLSVSQAQHACSSPRVLEFTVTPGLCTSASALVQGPSHTPPPNNPPPPVLHLILLEFPACSVLVYLHVTGLTVFPPDCKFRGVGILFSSVPGTWFVPDKRTRNK